VSTIGSTVGLTGGGGDGGGGAAGYPSPESRLAAATIGGGPVAQALMGAPDPSAPLRTGPYLSGSGGGLIGVPGRALGAAGAGLAIGANAAEYDNGLTNRVDYNALGPWLCDW
jgi:hypothetical protein